MFDAVSSKLSVKSIYYFVLESQAESEAWSKLAIRKIFSYAPKKISMAHAEKGSIKTMENMQLCKLLNL